MKVLILTDYSGGFWENQRDQRGQINFDVELLARELEGQGASVTLRRFSELDFRAERFAGVYVLYQSSEDPGLHYKSYLEDLLLGLELSGAVLVPPFRFFRAHDNKVFMEVLRDLSGNPAIQFPRARACGVLEDLRPEAWSYPVVVKSAAGSASWGVALARNATELVAIARRFSRTARFREWVEELRWRLKPGLRAPARSLHRSKFILQPYLPGLESDFKVLAFGQRFFVLNRKNRPSDFRASGSGLFSWPEQPPQEVLEFAAQAHACFGNPASSFDIAFDGRRCSLLEFQFVGFGTLTLRGANWCFEKLDQGWQRLPGAFLPEKEFARAVGEWLWVRQNETALPQSLDDDRNLNLNRPRETAR